jgi:hypothetical protein
MENILKAKDFYLQKQCSCGGTLTQTFLKINSNVMVKIKPKRSYFEIYVSNKLQVKGNTAQFETELNRYVQ